MMDLLELQLISRETYFIFWNLLDQNHQLSLWGLLYSDDCP